MARAVFDIEDAGALPGFVAGLMAVHPGLNVLINNAGIMRAEDMLAEPYDLSEAEAMIVTNLLGADPADRHLAAAPAGAKGRCGVERVVGLCLRTARHDAYLQRHQSQPAIVEPIAALSVAQNFGSGDRGRPARRRFGIVFQPFGNHGKNLTGLPNCGFFG